MDTLSARKIISSFSFMSGATFLTIILGMVTNKLIAVFAGPEGIGIVGLFRNFLGFIVPVLTVGTTTIIVQMISTSSSSEKVSEIVKSVFNLFIFQVIVVIIAAIFLSGYISNWLFPDSEQYEHVYEVRIVFAMSLAVLFSQTMIALINGKVNIKTVTMINIATALSTLLIAIPLIRLGNMGLAAIVGSGSLVGSAVGLYYVRLIYRKELRSFRLSLAALKKFSSLPISVWLLIHPLIVSATYLNIQVIVNKYYGINALGIYAAVAMLETTTIMLLMAAMKTYCLPTLGQLNIQKDKETFINKVLSILIIAVLPFILLLMFGAKYILWFLFSKEFQVGADILAVQSMAMLGQVFSWCYAMFMLHKGQYRTHVFVDAIWASFLSFAIWFVASNGFPLISISIMYVLGSLFSLILYLVVSYRLYGKGILDLRNFFLCIVALVLVLAGFFISQKATIVAQITFVTIVGASIVYFVSFNYKKLR